MPEIPVFFDYFSHPEPSAMESLKSRNTSEAKFLGVGAIISEMHSTLVRIVHGNGDKKARNGSYEFQEAKHARGHIQAWNPSIREVSRHTKKELMAGTCFLLFDEQWKNPQKVWFVELEKDWIESEGLIELVSAATALDRLGLAGEAKETLDHYGVPLPPYVYQVLPSGAGRIQLVV